MASRNSKLPDLHEMSNETSDTRNSLGSSSSTCSFRWITWLKPAQFQVWLTIYTWSIKIDSIISWLMILPLFFFFFFAVFMGQGPRLWVIIHHKCGKQSHLVLVKRGKRSSVAVIVLLIMIRKFIHWSQVSRKSCLLGCSPSAPNYPILRYKYETEFISFMKNLIDWWSLV